MTTRDPAADRVLKETLHELRRTRCRRKLRRTALATGAMAALAFAALFPSTPAAPPNPPPIARAHHEPEPPENDKLVAVVWRDGRPTLEELVPDELGYPVIEFNLDPVIAYSDSRWSTF